MIVIFGSPMRWPTSAGCRSSYGLVVLWLGMELLANQDGLVKGGCLAIQGKEVDTNNEKENPIAPMLALNPSIYPPFVFCVCEMCLRSPHHESSSMPNHSTLTPPAYKTVQKIPENSNDSRLPIWPQEYRSPFPFMINTQVQLR